MDASFDMSEWSESQTNLQPFPSLPSQSSPGIGGGSEADEERDCFEDQVLTDEVEDVLTFGDQRGWELRYLGKAPYPSKTVRLPIWKIVPAHLDATDIPRKAIRRVRQLEAAGFDFQGYVIAHELKSPRTIEDDSWEPQTAPTSYLETAKSVGRGMVKASGIVLPVVMGAAVVVGGLLVSLAATTILALGAIDPVLIAVTQHNGWIEIYRWDE